MLTVMTTDSEDCRILRTLRETEELFALLDAESGRELGVQKRLRSEFDADLVRAAMTLRDLQKRGEVKFDRSAEMWFDPKGLEQATSLNGMLRSTASPIASPLAMPTSRRSPVRTGCCTSTQTVATGSAEESRVSKTARRAWRSFSES